MVGQASAAEPWPPPTVNNFVAAAGEPIRMADRGRFRYRWIGFPASAGQVCLLRVASTTSSLSTGPSGGLGPLTTTPEGVALR